ncbi:MAG: membrane protein insertase YidC [Myxococcota bacterium]|nr:membrane protein insertase YidC [Myxococcota bacterium]
MDCKILPAIFFLLIGCDIDVDNNNHKTKTAEPSALVDPKRKPVSKNIALETQDYRAVFTTRGAALHSFTLKKPRYREVPRNWETGERSDTERQLAPVDLVTTNTEHFEMNAPLRFVISHNTKLESFVNEAEFQLAAFSKDKVVFKLGSPEQSTPIIVHKKYEIDPYQSTYQFWLTIRVTNIGKKTMRFYGAVTQHGYQHDSDTGGSMFSSPPDLLEGICRHNGTTDHFPWNTDDLHHPFHCTGNVDFVGVQTRYFLSAMMPDTGTSASCTLSKKLDDPGRYPAFASQPWGHVVAALRFGKVVLRPGESKIFRVKNFLGPKRHRLLQSVGRKLQTSVDLGFFRPISRGLLWLLFLFESFVGNWGLAIILLTVLVKLALSPITHRSFKTSARTKSVKPQIDAVNKHFGDDPQAKQKAVLELYKQHKINPLAGCLPMLLQMPVWIALYATLRTAPELYRAPFFGWITDLTSPDPYFVAPTIATVLMLVQSYITPMISDSEQQKLFAYLL